ncbi:MAG: hypothetical protein UT48_C0004G0030 [Parcubacteria group bacterium GW2011_GWE2_39_37]|uniref:Glycosyltransferase 2-like domain-containing protein n=1 Tax=Candidatus Falkowbacteria bacterium GW2011_GWF2_39_8 TaxID=1618642 RepID=A0A0G0PX09_9BACT|nr:MAG: hypothetical protein UT48_C0004G0030 [Parcubacteria group bacterium GW2011_GWE2_39_37]KKR32674.1 MAG: hypothetical protein UT64_C0026G0016 [Candidatus Falkowbacteria bacterium GW2011_GWF2_39_8]
MRKKIAIIIAPNWRDYAEKYLSDCLDSLVEQEFAGEGKYFFVDNESTETSFQYLKQVIENKFVSSREYEIVRILHNAGFAEGNNQAMRLAIEQGYDYLILFNMDTVVGNDAIKKMIEAAESADDIGIVQARLMLWDSSKQPEENKINSLGNTTHFLGFGFCEGYNEDVSRYKIDEIRNIFYPSGAAFLIKSKVIKEIGYFDEEFWMYNEDQDLGWRTWLAGYRCVLAPEAVVYHKYEFSRSITKYYWMDRNRLLVILKNYHLLTLLLILPTLIIMEFGLFLFALKGGWVRDKIKIYSYFLDLKNWRYIIKARQDCQKTRKIKDKEIVKMITGKIWYQEVDDWKLRAINPVFNLYWKIIKKIIIW